MFQVRFMEWLCYVVADTYMADGSLKLMLRDIEDGMPVATATVCAPHLLLNGDHKAVAVKDYSENEGMTTALVKAGIIEPRPIGITVCCDEVVRIHALTEAFRNHLINLNQRAA